MIKRGLSPPLLIGVSGQGEKLALAMLDCFAIKHPFLTAVPACAWGVIAIGFTCPRVKFASAHDIPVMGWIGAVWAWLRCA